MSGANGCGKSSLLWMLMGGLHPQEGRVTVNGAPIETINLKTLRQQVAFIPQRAVLFKGTVLDNLTNFDVDTNLAQALDLATALGLDRYFAGVPDGYEMEIGAATNGGLPSGVVQRIAMVRALVGDPQLILFDEANAALDQAGDKLMRELLVRYQTRAAIVIVSFRPSLLAIADRQYHLRDGRLVDVTPQASSTKEPPHEQDARRRRARHERSSGRALPRPALLSAAPDQLSAAMRTDTVASFRSKAPSPPACSRCCRRCNGAARPATLWRRCPTSPTTWT
nr:ATP-binding cassette domain-containing protein [Hankyongella ginsenosidimutans]